jgi:hypothetical protein
VLCVCFAVGVRRLAVVGPLRRSLVRPIGFAVARDFRGR